MIGKYDGSRNRHRISTIMNSRPLILALVLSALILGGCGSGLDEPTVVPATTTPEEVTGLANPASVNCEEQGYLLEIRSDENGAYGVCIFPDGSECEEWAFFRDECSPGDSLLPDEPAPDVSREGVSFSYDDSLASGVTVETIAAVGPDLVPPHGVAPEHLRFSFDDYIIPEVFFEPQVLVYPVVEFAALSERAAATINDLQQILADKPEALERIPFLPLPGGPQSLQIQVAYIDFQTGAGVRGVLWGGQGTPVNNRELFYTFQGLTSDGNYYVSVILPVSHSTLPADGFEIPGDDLQLFMANFETHLAEVEQQLGAEDPSSFMPQLALLDEVIQSLEVNIEEPADVPGEVLDVHEVALAFISGRYGEQAPAPDLTWTGRSALPENPPPGWSEYEFVTDYWVVTIGHAVLPPEQVVYQVKVANPTTGFQWEGEVNAVLQVTETLAPGAAQTIACWYGRIIEQPPGSQFDDYLALEPEGAGEVGIEGADAEIEAQIQGLRGSAIPAHFWGTLSCDVLDYGGCQLVVSQLRPDGPEAPFFAPEPVEGWEGTIVINPPGSQFDNYFQSTGDFAAEYGIGSSDPGIAAQLEGLGDTRTAVRVWGQVLCPAIDVNGASISVDRIETVSGAVIEDAYAGWETYTNGTFGYTLKYPGDCTVMGADLDASVQFVGPLVGNEHWPWFFVDHYDSEFYHPPLGSDLLQWLVDHNVAYDELAPETQVAGVDAVHLLTGATPQSYGADDYYFVKEGQLFHIQILHAGGQQDWELYTKFLDGFSFTGTP
jgi:putative hemolysin